MLKRQKLNEAENHMKEVAMQNPLRVGSSPQVLIGDEIEFRDVDIFSPGGQLLVRGLNFKVAKNTNVLVSGRNGSGKTIFFALFFFFSPFLLS
jgi:ABC-type uncharacterized transport system fused permease/ATPase subunit